MFFTVGAFSTSAVDCERVVHVYWRLSGSWLLDYLALYATTEISSAWMIMAGSGRISEMLIVLIDTVLCTHKKPRVVKRMKIFLGVSHRLG